MYEHGGDYLGINLIADFSTNINPLGMPESVRKAAIEAVELGCKYPDIHQSELKAAIAKMLHIREDIIFCGNGATEVISTVVSAVKPKKAILPVPTFYEYEKYLKLCGCEIIYYDMVKNASQINQIKLGNDIVDLIDESVDMVFLCNPNNPTGELISPSKIDLIASKCAMNNCLLVVDECFIALADGMYSIINPCQVNKSTFVIRAFTKSMAIPGIRLGYGVCADTDLIEKMDEIANAWRVSVIAQKAGVAASTEIAYLDRSRAMIRKERGRLKRALKECGFEVYDSRANFIFIKGDKAFAKKLLKKKIAVRDCSNFRGLTEGYFRVAVRTEAENDILLEAIREIYG